MNQTATLQRSATGAAVQRDGGARPKDDAAMLKAAASLTRDLNAPSDAIYWADMLGSALLGYGGLFAAIVLRSSWLALGCGLVAILALYRPGSFIHALTHIQQGAAKGLRLT